MTREKSCGAVVFTVADGQIKYLLVQGLGGVYGFPKGHVEAGETETETALREVFEETHVRISLIEGFRTVTEYALPGKPDTVKQVVYFLGEYRDQEVIHQREELLSACLVTYEQALTMFRFDDYRQILTQANDILLRRMGQDPL